MKSGVWMLGAVCLLGSLAWETQAQYVVGVPAVSYYAPAPVYQVAPAPATYFAPQVSTYAVPTQATYFAPTQVTYVAPQTMTYVVPQPNYVAPVTYYSPATSVSFYSAATGVPATVSRGIFGRTTVRTPYYKVKY